MRETLETLDKIKKTYREPDHLNPKLILPFTEDYFFQAIAKLHPNVTKAKIKESATFNYLIQYFHCNDELEENSGKLKAKLILIESKYFSESFISNLRYYNTSSSPHVSKLNTRIHFFDYQYEENFFEKAFISSDPKTKKKIWKKYLGYVTIRPLTGAIFGACFLKPYKSEDRYDGYSKRHYNSIIKSFRFDVFGKQVKLDGLPFQAQDISVGTCATYSIWMALFKLNKLFKSKMLSPYEITEAAGISTTDVKRMYPSRGMDARQILNAIRSSGLTAFNGGQTSHKSISCDCCGDLIEEFRDHLLVDHNFTENKNKPLIDNHYGQASGLDLSSLRRIIYSYNKMGIPILLTYSFRGFNNDRNHLVAINGFKTNTKPANEDCTEPTNEDVTESTNEDGAEPINEDNIKHVADHICTIYAHNDNHGPYEKFVPCNHKEDGLIFKSKEYKDGKLEEIEVRPELFFVPVHESIKISDSQIYESILAIEGSFKNFLKKINNPEYDPNNLVWDIYLDFAINYKQELFNATADTVYGNEIKEKILLTNFPKYVWIARLCKNEDLDDDKSRPYLDIIYDATSLPTENCIFQVNYLDEVFGKILTEFFKSLLNQESKKLNSSFNDDRMGFFVKSYENNI